MLRALPAGLPLSVEIPMQQLAQRSEPSIVRGKCALKPKCCSSRCRPFRQIHV
jgi:hypothetical protein